jgi:hypothetical protein
MKLRPVNPLVGGSNPSRGAIKTRHLSDSEVSNNPEGSTETSRPFGQFATAILDASSTYIAPTTTGQRVPTGAMQYLDYEGSVEFDDGCWHGRLLHIRDIVTYESDSIDGLASAFVGAVDDYLQTCHEYGDEPCRPTTPRVSP